MENIEEIIGIDPKYFAALDGNIIIGYYIDTIHDVESIASPYVEITEELWSALTADSARKECVDGSGIVDGKIYTINDLNLFQTVASSVVDFPKTLEELAIENLQGGLQETQTDLNNLQTDVDKKSDTVLLTTAEYEALEANGELNENTIYMLTDDTEEDDLIALVNEMNSIDYDVFLAFDTSEIV